MNTHEQTQAILTIDRCLMRLTVSREAFKQAVVIFLQDHNQEEITKKLQAYKTDTIEAITELMGANKVLDIDNTENEAMVLHIKNMKTPTVEEIEVRAKRAMTRDSMLNPNAKVFSDN